MQRWVSLATNLVLVLPSLVIIAGVVLTILFFLPGPSTALECGEADRVIASSRPFADQFQLKWDSFNRSLDAGIAATATFDESEVTSRANRFMQEKPDPPFQDIVICMSSGDPTGEFEAIARSDIPALPDRIIRVRGSIDLQGEVPLVDIREIDIGKIFGFVLSVSGVQGALEDEMNDQLETLVLRHRYRIELSQSSLKVTGAQ